MRPKLILSLALVVATLIACRDQLAEAQAKPNILVIMGDDIGYWNLSTYNQGMMAYRTPNIDSISNDGMKFTDAYAENSCTAGRSAFITGQSPFRTGLLKVGLPGAGGFKESKLKSDDFFAVDQNPLITFKSTKIVQSGPNTFEVAGDFTIRGVTKREKLTLAVSGKGTGSGEISGTMAFDRKDYGMNSGIPFIKIANRVEVTVSLKGNRVSGPRWSSSSNPRGF